MRQKHDWNIRIMLAMLAAASVSAMAAVPGTDENRDERSANRSGYLGVMTEKLTPEDKAELKADFGVKITEIEDDSPAEKAGLDEEDVIRSVNGDEIRKPEDLVRKIRKIGPGKEIKIGILREGKRMEIKAETGWLPGSFGDADSGSRRVFRMTFPGSKLLGVRLTELNSDLAEYFKAQEGALVLEVDEDGPAERAGVKAGDVIVRVEDDEITEPADVTAAMSDLEDGDDAELTVIRKGVKQTLEVEIEEKWDGSEFRDRRSGFGPGPGFDIQIEMDEESQERLKEQLERVQEKLEGGMEKLKRELEELEDTTWI
jgi:membrane-associated protease RseP (regulator of RpoE activity)